MLPAIFGLSGPTLTADEASFFRAANPAGFILFARNIEQRQQVRRLTDDLRHVVGRDDVLILVDQEGGRVARLGPPIWPTWPSAATLAQGYENQPMIARHRVALNYEALALDLIEVGINTACAPVLDVLSPVTHAVIGDRAFGASAQQVADLGRACLDGLHMGGALGVIKHIPGHGRGAVDSHETLPVVEASDDDLAADVAPFSALSDAEMAMTAHITYRAWDEVHCATLSPTVIEAVIRGRIGFDGLLMSDDLDMKALAGEVPALAAQALAAGCDLALNCWGRMVDMEGIAKALPTASDACAKRLSRATRRLRCGAMGADIGERREVLLAARDRLLTGFG